MKKRILVVFAAICLQAILAFAQSTTGKIVGTVTAPDGALVPGATIVVTDNQTNKERTITASDDGTFEVPQLEFGTYTVKITATGYKAFTTTNVKVDAAREFSLKAQLEVGQITETVTVTAEGLEQINATNGELSTTISTQQVRELPLNGRNPLSLLNLTAGASTTSGSINGQRTSATTITRDGLNVQDNFIRSGTFVGDQPTVDDVSELTITTQNAGSEQGAGASFVQLVTPRGGSKFHGNLFAFNRNSQFTANTFFNNANGVAKPFLNRNQYGGSISGPMPMFNFGEGGSMFSKNKAFFFFNYEDFRLAQQATITGLTTLLPPARNGSFTYVNAATGASTTVNALTGAGFSSVPTAAQGGVLQVDPIIASRYLNNLPTTANGVTTGVNYTQTLSMLRKDPRTRPGWTTRIDIDINDKNSLSGVYKQNNDQDARTDQHGGFSQEAFVNASTPTKFLALSYRRTFSNSFSNEVRGGLQDLEVFFNESNVPTDFIISTTGGLALTNPQGTFRDQGRKQYYRNFQDNAVYTIGNHSFRFGFNYDSYNIRSLNFGGTTPTYTIATSGNTAIPALTAEQVCGTATCINTTDLARLTNLRYFLGGIVGAASRTANIIDPSAGYGFGPSDQKLNFKIYAGYFADQWRLRPNLTLNLGMRYELFTPLNSPQAIFLEPVITNDDLVASVLNPNAVLDIVGGNAGRHGDFFKADKDNFAPNISVAWSPRFEKGFLAKILGNTFVVRGGASVNYFNDEYLKASSTLAAGNTGLGALNVNAIRPGTTSTVLNASISNLPGFISVPSLLTPPAFTPPPRSFLAVNNAAGGLGQVFGTDPNFQIPRVYQWNIGIQRSIGFKTVFEARYVGNKSNDLVRTVDYNEIDVNNNGFMPDFYRAQANLAAVDAERAKRIAAGQSLTNVPRSLAFNANVPGSQQLQVISQFVTNFGVNPLTNTTLLTQVQQGAAGSYAQNVVANLLNGPIKFQANPNIFITEIIGNAGRYDYHALQVEVRRRFSNGLSFQANYTFQKTLTDVPGEDQNRQGEVQEANNPNLNYGRSDNDRTMVFNANVIYELPFGKGKSFLNRGGWVDRIFGGWQFTSIINLETGVPVGIIDPRGTESIAFKSGRQSATSTLNHNQIKALAGEFRTPNGVYFINPSVLNATITNATTGEVKTGFDLFQPLPAGFTLTSVRATSPINTAPFPGQVFFFNGIDGKPANGNLPRNFLNGTPFRNWDAGLSKNIRIGETRRIQVRVEAFNVLNKMSLAQTADLNINSNSFGRITTTRAASTPRIIQFGVRYDF